MMTRRKCSKSKLANVELPQNQMTSYLKISYHVDFEIRIALKIPKFCLLVLYRMTIYQKSRCLKHILKLDSISNRVTFYYIQKHENPSLNKIYLNVLSIYCRL